MESINQPWGPMLRNCFCLISPHSQDPQTRASLPWLAPKPNLLDPIEPQTNPTHQPRLTAQGQNTLRSFSVKQPLTKQSTSTIGQLPLPSSPSLKGGPSTLSSRSVDRSGRFSLRMSIQGDAKSNVLNAVQTFSRSPQTQNDRATLLKTVNADFTHDLESTFFILQTFLDDNILQPSDFATILSKSYRDPDLDKRAFLSQLTQSTADFINDNILNGDQLLALLQQYISASAAISPSAVGSRITQLSKALDSDAIDACQSFMLTIKGSGLAPGAYKLIDAAKAASGTPAPTGSKRPTNMVQKPLVAFFSTKIT